MTRYTNLEKKKFEKAAGFNVSPLIPEQGKTQEVASKESEEKIEHKKKSPINNKKRTLDNEEINNIISVKEENNVKVPKSKFKLKKKRNKRESSNQVDEHIVNKVTKSERRRLRRIRERHSNTICYGCREQGHSVRDCPIAKEKGVGICYNCGSAEHTAKDCRRSSNANKYQYAKCFVCNEQGHLSSKCPKNEKGLYPNGGGCRFCGKVDHLAKDCTLKKEDLGIVSVGKIDLNHADDDDYHLFIKEKKKFKKEEEQNEILSFAHAKKIKSEKKKIINFF